MRYSSEKLRILGVDSKTCIATMESRLHRLDCVLVFNVDIRSGLAEVVYNADKCNLNDIYEAIKDAGYDVHKGSVIFKADKLSPRDAIQLEGELLRMAGILEARASPATRLIKVVYNPLTTDMQSLLGYLKDTGFNVRPVTRARPTTYTYRFRRFIASMRIFTFIVSVVVISDALISASRVIELEYLIPPQVHLTLAMTAIALTGDVLIRGIKALLKCSPTSESLAALSTLISFMAGTLTLTSYLQYPGIDASPRFFLGIAAGICGFLSLGVFLEERLKSWNAGYLEEPVQRYLGKARVLRKNGTSEVDAFKVKPGDIVEVNAGEMIPVDGVVVEGWGYVNEISFTSSPLPVVKRSNLRDPVYAGSLLVSGSMRVRATRPGEEALFMHIIEAAREARSRKPTVRKAVDKVCNVITWMALGIGIFTALYWWFTRKSLQLALIFTATVFATTYPWALGIAAPLIITLAAYKASKTGILIRSGDVFERVPKVTVVLFDKTRVLTVGKLAIKSLYVANALSDEEVLYYVCGLESRGSHPLALAINEYCSSRGVRYGSPSHYKHVPQKGTVGRVGDREVIIGRYEAVKGLKIRVNEGTEFLVNYLENRGSLPLVIVFDRKVAGILEVADSVRNGSLEAVKALKRRGLAAGIVSGDREASVSYYARVFELNLAYPEMRPQDKAKLVAEMQHKGERVMFVGKGINDAIALSAAFVGVAMGNDFGIVKEFGDVVLSNDDLAGLLRLFELSELVKRKLYQNLVLAFIYNVFLALLATGVLYELFGLVVKPLLVYAAMILGLLSVAMNAGTLLRTRIT
ncbi:MAG: heavy metal translocating P-type ATPase [Desulfurococcaceae archaeon]